MKLLIATPLYPPQAGGPATYAKLLADKLPGMGFQVRVINFGDLLKYPKGIRHIIYFFKVLSGAVSSGAVLALDPVSVGLPALAASKLLGKKFFVKIVGDYAWEQGVQRFRVSDSLDEFSTNDSEVYPWQVRVLKKVELIVANGADKIIVPSEYLKKIVSNWGVQPEKIRVIYNAFSKANILRSKEELRREMGWQTPTVVSAGRLVPWKGFGALIKIWPQVAEKVPGAALLIAGDGPEHKSLRHEINNLKLEHSVKLLGRLEQPELFEKIKAADAFVLNTGYEGLSHQLLEVMSLETPIVTTSVGGNPEVITSGESGLLVPYGDEGALKEAVVAVLEGKETALRFAMNGKNRVSRFDEGKMLESLAAFLRA